MTKREGHAMPIFATTVFILLAFAFGYLRGYVTGYDEGAKQRTPEPPGGLGRLVEEKAEGRAEEQAQTAPVKAMSKAAGVR